LVDDGRLDAGLVIGLWLLENFPLSCHRRGVGGQPGAGKIKLDKKEGA
jgi:hypothetical protein